jgi:hypothetical protein
MKVKIEAVLTLSQPKRKIVCLNCGDWTAREGYWSSEGFLCDLCVQAIIGILGATRTEIKEDGDEHDA